MHLNRWVSHRSILLHYHHHQVFSEVKNILPHRSVIPKDILNSLFHLNISSMHTCHHHLRLLLHLFNNHLYTWKVMIHSREPIWSINSMNLDMFGHLKRIISTKQINQPHHWMIILSSMLLITMQRNSRIITEKDSSR